MAFHRILGSRFFAIAFFQHLILQAAGQCYHTILFGILCQIMLTCLFMCLALLGTLLVDFLFLCSKELLHNTLSITALDL